MGRMVRTDYLGVFTALVALAVATLLSVLLVALSAPPAKADNTECVGTLPPGIYGNIVVPKGQSCLLEDSIVEGNVRALEDSQLIARDNNIDGNVQGNKADVVLIENTDTIPDIVGGNIHLKQGNESAIVCGQTLPSGNIHIEKFGPEAEGIGVGDDEFCPAEVGGGGNILEKGNVLVMDNAMAPVSNLGVDQNNVNGNVLIYKNSGTGNKTVAFNTISKNLQCKDNDPPFLAPPGSNDVEGKNDCPELELPT